jgi:hypothetical protein
VLERTRDGEVHRLGSGRERENVLVNEFKSMAGQ